MTPPPVQNTIAPIVPPPGGTGASNKAVLSLILGILGLVCLGFLAGIPAIFLGRAELAEIDQGKSPVANRSLAKIGYILGIVGTILSCLGFVVYIVLIGFMFKSSNSPSFPTF